MSEREVQIMCRICMAHVGGVLVSNAVRWSYCEDCERRSGEKRECVNIWFATDLGRHVVCVLPEGHEGLCHADRRQGPHSTEGGDDDRARHGASASAHGADVATEGSVEESDALAEDVATSSAGPSSSAGEDEEIAQIEADLHRMEVEISGSDPRFVSDEVVAITRHVRTLLTRLRTRPSAQEARTKIRPNPSSTSRLELGKARKGPSA